MESSGVKSAAQMSDALRPTWEQQCRSGSRSDLGIQFQLASTFNRGCTSSFEAETANQFHNSTKDLKSFQHVYAESDVERSRYRRETCRNIDSCLGGRGPNAVNLFCIPSFAKIWPKPNFGRSFARQEKKSRARERLGSRNRSSSHNSSAQRVEPPEKYATRQSCRYRSASQARAAR